MNTGQTLLTIVAITLLGSNIISINRTFTQHGTILQQTEIGIFGVSLAISILEEAQGKAFDQVTADSGIVTKLNELSSTLGNDGAETTRITFNDFDDYNGWKDTVDVLGVDTFRRWASVVYVDTTNLNGSSSNRTWHKKLTVYVKGNSTRDTLQMSYVFSYWSFR